VAGAHYGSALATPYVSPGIKTMSANNLRHLSDDALLYLIAAREPDALEVVYDRHVSPVWKLALLTCGNTAAAEQAVYEAFIDLWRQPCPDDTRPLVARLLSCVQSRNSHAGASRTNAEPGRKFYRSERT
jgi:hypothetical protein